jgi:hypothetical protein
VALLEWVKANVGRAIDVDHEYGPQCVDLVESYLTDVLRQPRWPGNAVTFASQVFPKWRWVPNAPTNYPVVGDVVVWGQNAEVGTTAFGHCAVVLAANPNVLLVFSQNWPAFSPAQLKLMDYRGVLGWQHYKGG